MAINGVIERPDPSSAPFPGFTKQETDLVFNAVLCSSRHHGGPTYKLRRHRLQRCAARFTQRNIDSDDIPAMDGG